MEKRQNTGNRTASPYTPEEIKIARIMRTHPKVNSPVCEGKEKKKKMSERTGK